MKVRSSVVQSLQLKEEEQPILRPRKEKSRDKKKKLKKKTKTTKRSKTR